MKASSIALKAPFHPLVGDHLTNRHIRYMFLLATLILLHVSLGIESRSSCITHYHPTHRSFDDGERRRDSSRNWLMLAFVPWTFHVLSDDINEILIHQWIFRSIICMRHEEISFFIKIAHRCLLILSQKGVFTWLYCTIHARKAMNLRLLYMLSRLDQSDQNKIHQKQRIHLKKVNLDWWVYRGRSDTVQSLISKASQTRLLITTSII
jgi:hypothetical protein